MIHFINPHGGFMPYSTLSLAGTAIRVTGPEKTSLIYTQKLG